MSQSRRRRKVGVTEQDCLKKGKTVYFDNEEGWIQEIEGEIFDGEELKNGEYTFRFRRRIGRQKYQFEEHLVTRDDLRHVIG